MFRCVVTNQITKCFKGQGKDSGSCLKFNSWNINLIYAKHFYLHYWSHLLYKSSWKSFYYYFHLIGIIPRLLYSDYLYKLQSHWETYVEAWSFYSKFSQNYPWFSHSINGGNHMPDQQWDVWEILHLHY